MSDESGAKSTRIKALAFVLTFAFVIAGVAAISAYLPKGAEANNATTAASGYVSSNSLGGLPYFNASAVYASLGFPMVSYSSAGTEIPYLRSEPNFTLQVELGAEDYYPEYAKILAPVIGLKEAVSLGAAAAKLNPANYTLAAAIFYPGLASSMGLLSDPEWHLYFEQIYAGYWIYYTDYGGWPIEADVNALNGTVAVSGAPLSNLPEPGHYDLSVSPSSALATVRALNLTDDPVLTKNGTLGSITPYVVFPGISPLTQWVNASLVGESGLAWIIGLGYETPCCSHGGTFAVDAQTGKFLGDTELEGFSTPAMIGYVTTSFVFSTARNLSVSQQTYPINATAIGRSGSVLAAFPDVLTVMPGSTASIELNVSAGDMQNPPTVSFSFASGFRDPVQNVSSSGSPPGVAFGLSTPDLALQSGRSADTALLISVDQNATVGTYFIILEPVQSPASQVVGGNVIYFFLSVWNGIGQWPPPPLIG